MNRLLSVILILIGSAFADAASLRCHVNVNHYAATYFRESPERLAFDGVVTDLWAVVAPDVTDPPAAYRDALLAAQQANPTAVIGTYLSSRMVRQRADLRHFPAECLDPRYFTAAEFMPAPYKPSGEPGEFVDYRQPVARAKLIALIVNEAVARGRPVLFTDNWAHDFSWPGFIPWKVTADFMADLHAALKARGVKLYVNVAIAIGEVPDADVVRLAAACDGVTLEMPLVPIVAKDPVLLAHAVTQYQILTAKKVTVVLIGAGDEAKFLAGLAMVLDGPLVTAPFFSENPDWQMWPDQFGRPTGTVKQDGTTLSRDFLRGRIKVDCAARTVATN